MSPSITLSSVKSKTTEPQQEIMANGLLVGVTVGVAVLVGVLVGLIVLVGVLV